MVAVWQPLLVEDRFLHTVTTKPVVWRSRARRPLKPKDSAATAHVATGRRHPVFTLVGALIMARRQGFCLARHFPIQSSGTSLSQYRSIGGVAFPSAGTSSN